MALILNLETATTNCSVSLATNGEVVAIKELDTPNFSHSEQLHLFVQEVTEEAGVVLSDLDAVAVSKGPGSYTGLRIGVSAAKGLCFSLDVPLISIATLTSMAHQALTHTIDQNVDKGTHRSDPIFAIPVLDARRMEVYSAVFDRQGAQIRETRAEIIDANAFNEYPRQGKTIVLGNGAKKCIPVLEHPNFSFKTDVVPSAREMAELSYRKFESGEFENVAYFEPYYLKDFILTTRKR